MKADLAKGVVLRFGAFELDLGNRELRCNGVLVALQPQPFNLLALLASRPDRLVTREEIRRELWPDEQTGDFDSRLNFYVRKIREALDDNADRPHYIKTHRKFGYTFIAPVNGHRAAVQAPSDLSRPVSGDVPLALDGHVPGSGSINERQGSSPGVPETVPAMLDRASGQDARAPRTGRLRLGIALAGFVGLAILAWPVVGFLWRSLLTPKITGRIQLTHDGWHKLRSIRSRGGRVYFTEERDGQETIAWVPETGGDTVTVPAPFRHPVVADVSPDGSRLLVIDQRFASLEEGPLWEVRAKDAALDRLGSVTAIVARLGPDGNGIVYSHGHDLWSAKRDGSDPQKLAALPGVGGQICWSPDGRRLRILVVDAAAETSSIWEADASGSDLHRALPEKDIDSDDGILGWTPDGRYFGYRSHEGGKPEVHWLRQETSLFGRASSSAPRLDLGEPKFDNASLSEDGRKIFGTVILQERGALLRYDSAGHRFVEYLRGLSAMDLAFSRDGSQMAYVLRPEATLWRARADGSEPRELTFYPFEAQLPAWSPDGKQIAFMERELGKPWRIQIIPAEGGKPEPLLPYDDAAEGAPTWSSDGGAIVFGDVDCIAAGCAIHQVDLGSRQVTTLPGSRNRRTARWSPDGRYVAALGQDRENVVLFDFKTKQWTSLLDGPAVGDSLAWSRDGRYLYGLMDEGTDSKIFRIRIRDRRLEPLASLVGVTPLLESWFGLDPQDSPLMFKGRAGSEIFAISFEVR